MELIRNHETEFSKSEKELARIIEKSPEQCALYSLVQFSQYTKLGEATIIRFSKKLGFSGFSELSHVLKDRIKNTFSISSRFNQAMKGDDTGEGMVDSFIALQIGYLEAVRKVIASSQFSVLCEVIEKAHALYLFEDGGASKSPGDTLEFWLVRFGLEIKRIDSLGHRVFDLIVHHEDGDVFIGFCFGKDNLDLTKLLLYCKDEGITTLLITDCTDGTDIKLADHVLVLERGPLELFHSMSVPVLLAESISLSVAKQRGEVSSDNLKKLDDLRRKYDI